MKNAPFDVAAFFAAPPLEENAAARYLDAFFEFSSEVAVCFPEGSDRDSRKQAVDERWGRFGALFQALQQDPKSVPAASIDAMVDVYDTGFRKLDWAQKRPRCVFQSGLGVTAVLPHIQAARQVSRVAQWKVRRELDRGEIDAALRDLARLLRLSRDLLPRGELIIAMVHSAIDSTIVKTVVIPVLTTAALTTEQCDRLLALLIEHDERSVDAYSEGLRTDYLSTRATWYDLIADQAGLRAHWARIGRPIDPSSSIVAEIAEPVLYSALPKNAPVPASRPADGKPFDALIKQITSLKNTPNLDARIARTTPEELSRQVDKLNELYRDLLGVADSSYPDRIRKTSRQPASLDAVDIHTRVTRGLLSAFTAFTAALTRSKATIRVAEGLVLVRRWQLRHGGDVPPSLEAAAEEADRPSMPLDPYDRRPIRFTVVEAGRPSTPSARTDGTTAGGRDNARTPDSGDLLPAKSCRVRHAGLPVACLDRGRPHHRSEASRFEAVSTARNRTRRMPARVLASARHLASMLALRASERSSKRLAAAAGRRSDGRAAAHTMRGWAGVVLGVSGEQPAVRSRKIKGWSRCPTPRCRVRERSCGRPSGLSRARRDHGVVNLFSSLSPPPAWTTALGADPADFPDKRIGLVARAGARAWRRAGASTVRDARAGFRESDSHRKDPGTKRGSTASGRHCPQKVRRDR